MRSGIWRLAAAFLGLTCASCRSAVQELSHDGLPAAVALDGCAAAVASRFGPVELDPALRAARPRFARDSMSPSRLFTDLSLWSRQEGPGRWLEFGSGGGMPYRVGRQRPAPSSSRAGAYRGSIHLTSLDPGDFEWAVREDLSIGRVRVESLTRAFSALLRGIEALTSEQLLDLVRRSLPRSTAAFGRLFTLEPVLVSQGASGVLVTLRVAIEPERIRAAFPRYARFLEQYLTPMRLRLVVRDAAGAPLWELASTDNRLSLTFRAFQGALAPLQGPPRPLPDRQQATVALSLKSGIFTVGFDDLVVDVSLVRGAGEQSFRAAFTREPAWQLPLVVKPLLRAPLRRPFQEGGALLAMRVYETEGATLVEREYRFAVRESFVVRWLGSFGGGMATVFRAGAEAEADRFMGECLWALRDDLVLVATSAEPAPP